MHRLGMTIERNPYNEPFWFQLVGVLENPARPLAEAFTLRTNEILNPTTIEETA